MSTNHQQPLRETLTVQHDPDSDDYFIVFPQHFLDALGWKEGDTVVWRNDENGSWTLSKKSV